MSKKEFTLSDCCRAYVHEESPSGHHQDPRAVTVCNGCGKPAKNVFMIDDEFEDDGVDLIMPCRICKHKSKLASDCKGCIHSYCITNHDVIQDIDTRE